MGRIGLSFARPLLIMIGIVHVILGAWMVAAPKLWFEKFPAELHETGPFNSHFVGDVGVAYVLTGVVCLIAAKKPTPTARGAFMAIAAFHVGHACWHVYQTVTNVLPFPDRFVTDLPVYAGTGVLVYLCLPKPWNTIVASATARQPYEAVDMVDMGASRARRHD